MPEILIGDNSPCFGNAICSRLNEFGASCTCSENAFPDIKRYLKGSDRYDVLLLFITTKSKFSCDPASEIQDIKRCCPNIKIITAIFSLSPEYSSRYLNAGTDSCLVMPMHDCQIAHITMDIARNKSSSIYPHIAQFLRSNGFPDNIPAFPYFVYAVEITLNKPHSPDSLMNGLYNELAEKFSTQASTISGRINSYARAACKGNAVLHLTKNENSKLDAAELIYVVCDHYLSEHHKAP